MLSTPCICSNARCSSSGVDFESAKHRGKDEKSIGEMINLWEPKLHIARGFCYTFQSKEAPVFMGDDDILNEKLSSLVLELDVSLIFLIY